MTIEEIPKRVRDSFGDFIEDREFNTALLYAWRESSKLMAEAIKDKLELHGDYYWIHKDEIRRLILPGETVEKGDCGTGGNPHEVDLHSRICMKCGEDVDE